MTMNLAILVGAALLSAPQVPTPLERIPPKYYAVKEEETETERVIKGLEKDSKRFYGNNDDAQTGKYRGNHYQRTHLTRRQMPAHQDYRQKRASAHK